MVNLNTIAYLLIILFYTVSSLYCSYPAYLLRQLRSVFAIAVYLASILRNAGCYITK
jgi:hypothetical protein